MNRTLMASIFAIVAIGALGTMGIVTTFQSVKADVKCNPSDGCQPPGHQNFGNAGQCQKTVNTDFGLGKQYAHDICHL